MIYVFLANGFEEIEGLTVVDFLRRAELEVCTVGVGGKLITGAHNIPVFCDLDESEVRLDGELEAVVLPGGMPGTLNLENSSAVQKVIDNANNTNAFICAICAAPSILGHKGLLSGKKAVCFPGFENSLEGCESCCEYVVTDGKFITAKGAGVCIDFGLEIVKQLRGGELSDEIRKSIQSR